MINILLYIIFYVIDVQYIVSLFICSFLTLDSLNRRQKKREIIIYYNVCIDH